MDILGCIEGYTVRLVDGETVRKDDPDFNNYGHHDTDSKIPKKEIWLDSTSDPQELTLFLLRALYERFLYDRGLPEDQVTIAAKTLDQVLRQQQPEEAIKVKYLTHIGDKDLWLVRGDQVRKQHDPSFILGGNGYRYSYVPKNELWVEDVLSPTDRAFTFLHEIYEASLMQGGKDYESAHVQATKLEKKLRNLVSR